MVRIRFAAAALVVIALSTAPAAFAGQKRAAQEPLQADQGAGITPDDVQGMFDEWALVQAQSALQLNEAQYGRFVPRLKALQDARRRQQRERLRLLNELRKLVNAPGATPDDTEVRAALKALRDQEERSIDEVRKAVDGVDELLDPVQQARFRLFEERMDARKLELLVRARANARLRNRGR